jgi:hypothetical protein
MLDPKYKVFRVSYLDLVLNSFLFYKEFKIYRLAKSIFDGKVPEKNSIVQILCHV